MDVTPALGFSTGWAVLATALVNWPPGFWNQAFLPPYQMAVQSALASATTYWPPATTLLPQFGPSVAFTFGMYGSLIIADVVEAEV